MTKVRRFSKAEIMDAAQAAAKTGLDLEMSADGKILFTHRNARSKVTASPKNSDERLERWISEDKAAGRA